MLSTQTKWIRISLASGSLMGLLAVYLLQKTTFAFLTFDAPVLTYLAHRTLRFFLNDIFALGLIASLFYERKYIVFALWVQALGVLFLLLPYFVFKIYHPGYDGPLVSFIHRLILNPTLLLLLIPAFYYQKSQKAQMNGRSN